MPLLRLHISCVEVGSQIGRDRILARTQLLRNSGEEQPNPSACISPQLPHTEEWLFCRVTQGGVEYLRDTATHEKYIIRRATQWPGKIFFNGEMVICLQETSLLWPDRVLCAGMSICQKGINSNSRNNLTLGS